MASGREFLLEVLRSKAPSLSVHDRTSPTFADLQLYYNRGLAQDPLAIVQPKTEDEVSKVIAFCSAQGIPLAVRSGGHDFFGRSQADGGIVLDMRSVDYIDVASDKASVRVGGGVLAGALQQKLNSHGLFTPTGHASSVGYVSWACGGGYGFYVGTYGFGVDQIVGARVVVAGGRVVDTDHDVELLWGLRGAGAGTFGVVTELRVKVYPVPRLYAGLLAYPLSEVPIILERFESLISEGGLPDEFSGDAVVARPEMFQLPGSEPCLTFLWCWTSLKDDITSAKIFFEKMKGLGTVVANTVEETIPSRLPGGDFSSVTFFRSCAVSSLKPGIGAIFARNPPPQPLAAVVIHNNHGRGIRDDAADGVGASFHNRHAHVILGLQGGTHSGTVSGADISQATDWVTVIKKEVSESSAALPEGFPSFSPPEEVNPAGFFGVEAADRLLQLKKRLDPENFFRKGFPQLC